jgi:hypothetical protein
MTKNLGSVTGITIRPAAESGRFDRISISLHWLTVLLIVGQFTSAWLREAVGHESSHAVAILAAHRAMGMLTWIVGLLRLVWRHNFAYLPPFPESMPKLQQSIAKANEYGLYAWFSCSRSPVLVEPCFTACPLNCSPGKCLRCWSRTRRSAACSWRLTSSAPRRCSP